MDMRLSDIKIIVFVLVTCFSLQPASYAFSEEFSGPYATNLVWDGDVTMTGDVLVLEGASLMIRAGTKVRVVPAEGTKIDPATQEVVVEGITGMADNVIGHGGRAFVGLLSAFFVYILISNLLGLVPGFSPPTSHSGVTFGLGAVAVVGQDAFVIVNGNFLSGRTARIGLLR